MGDAVGVWFGSATLTINYDKLALSRAEELTMTTRESVFAHNLNYRPFYAKIKGYL